MQTLYKICYEYFLCTFFLIFLSDISVAAADSLNIKNFGAKGDGITNDYPAFLAAVTQINSNGGHSILTVPEGNYIIDVYNTAVKKYSDLEFDNCTDISIIGLSAVINIKVNYYRAADYTTSKKGKTVLRSKTYSIIPFSFNNCNKVVLSGFEVNGNVDKIARDLKVVESPSHLVKIWETENMTIRNMYLHHGITDGIYIGGTKKFSEKINLYNVVSSCNARQGMSIVNLRNGIFEKCSFINTGYFTGKYGYHPPGAGVDIEPIRKNINGEKTGNIKFIDCKFENNVGGQIRNGRANSVDSVFFIKDSISAGTSISKYQLVLGCGYSELNRCYINIGNGVFYSTSMRATDHQFTLVTNSEIYIGNGSIISTAASSQIATVKLIHNKIYCEEQDNNHNSWFDLQYANVQLLNNDVYFPNAYLLKNKEDIYIGTQKLKTNNLVKRSEH